MKKRIFSMLLCSAMVASMFAGCGGGQGAGSDTEAGGSDPTPDVTEASTEDEWDSVTVDDKTIVLYSFTDEVPKMVQHYIDTHPDFGYKVAVRIVPTTDQAYQPALDQALKANDNKSPDIYTAEAAFVLKYTQGDAASFACPYEELGIADVDAKLKDAEIAQYTVDIGTNPDGKLVGLGYQATGGAFIYRRSIAKDTFGTDDPKEIEKLIGAGTGNHDKFFEAAKTLKDKGYAIVSGDGDMWHALENSSKSGWVVDGKLVIDPTRESLLDVSKTLTDEGYSNITQDWQDAWFADMKGAGDKPVFGFFGPAWLINYTLGPNCGGEKAGEGTYGDWAVCAPPVGFFWGGTWIIANKNSSKKEAVAKIVEWITLDATEDGLQYHWASGDLYGVGGTKDAVASGKVMSMVDGSLDFLAGQNMFDAFIPANAYANGKCLTQYDETINAKWRDQVRAYAAGKKSRDEAIEAFKQVVNDEIGIPSK